MEIRNTVWKRITGCALAACLLICLLSGIVLPAQAAVPEDAVVIWDLENVPEDLYASDWAWDYAERDGGNYHGLVDAKRAEGKGVDGSTAVGITYKEGAQNKLYGNGVSLRIAKDETADNDLLGANQIWFWADFSNFSSELKLDMQLNGASLRIGRTYYYRSGNKVITERTPLAYTGATYGRLKLPTGYKGWVGVEINAFNTSFGEIEHIGFNFECSADGANFPKTWYVDQFMVVKGEVNEALIAEGDLFNSDISAEGQSLVYTDLTHTYQTVKSFGASGAWWTTGMGETAAAEKALRLLYTDEGIALNNYRHNVGGGMEDDKSDGPAEKDWRAPYSPLMVDGTYDIDRDLGAYTALKKIVELGTADEIVLFINSPPAYMTNNAKTFGSPWIADGKDTSNLRKDCYDLFAEYVVDLAEMYIADGVPVKYISPVNEPNASWNSNSQEGCHYNVDDALVIWEKCIVELEARKAENPYLKDVKIAVSETSNWNDKTYINYLYMKIIGNPVISEHIDSFGAHSYSSGDWIKGEVNKLVNSFGENAITLRQTEWGGAEGASNLGITSGVEAARVIHEDLTLLNVESWSYWLGASHYNYVDGLVYISEQSDDVLTSKRFWAMGNFSRFITGATRVTVDSYGLSDDVYVSAYVQPEDDSLVYVFVNDSNKNETFAFSGMPAGTTAQVYETSCVRDLELRGTVNANNGYVLPAMSVTTFVFQDLDLQTVANGSHPENPQGTKPIEGFDFTLLTDPQAAAQEPSAEAEDPSEPDGQETDGNSDAGLRWASAVFAVLAVAVGVITVLFGKKKTA